MCPVTFRPSDILTLNMYGTFTKFRLPGQTILAASAVSLTDIINKTVSARGLPFQKPYGVAPAATHEIPLDPGYACIIERFNWGDTSAPDKVYYEIHNWGKVVVPQMQEGFHCGGSIGRADTDNRSTHPTASEHLELKIWNCTADLAVPEDVYYEFAVWYYLFELVYLPEIMSLSFDALFDRQNDMLEAIYRQLESINLALRERAPIPFPPLSPASIEASAPGRRYATLPSACKCASCGHIIENPGQHCNQIPCPVCGASMWRVK